ncbi:MAG TPA: ATP-binding protein [Geminicoccus sp.]|uniref:two-component system sensor histidine kinase NtrB n=1 Tax=Geminicoccus sp. TaxID=2024832 RepID=UPI002E35351D|nr:ATP-binding protein [Geminicoccus sp.]HEX2527811.1 ATP-binding protein [Geminicoccus sp.]
MGAAQLVANLPSPLFVVDDQLRLKSVNPAAEQLFGASWNVLIDRSLSDFLPPHAAAIDLIRHVREEGASISEYGIELALSKGDTVSVDSHMTPIVECPGHVLVVLHPCTVARRLDQHRVQRGSARSVATLAATLAHEVKNPLSGIRGAAQLLEPTISEEDRPLVQLICDETDRICALVDRMEEFSAGRPLDRTPVNIHQILEHVRRIAENGFARRHRIVENYDPSLPDVEGDRDKLIQVFLNLIKNAAEAAQPDGGTITLSTTYQHGWRMALGTSRERLHLPITVEVKDDGPGVAPDVADHLFEPFVTSKPRGTGLGLALVAKIVHDHGGVVSYHPGDPGAVFRVSLPANRSGSRAAREEGHEEISIP